MRGLEMREFVGVFAKEGKTMQDTICDTVSARYREMKGAVITHTEKAYTHKLMADGLLKERFNGEFLNVCVFGTKDERAERENCTLRCF